MIRNVFIVLFVVFLLTSIFYVEVRAQVAKEVSKFTVLTSSTGDEIEFMNGEVRLENLKPGENNFLLVKHYTNGPSEVSEGFRIFFKQSLPSDDLKQDLPDTPLGQTEETALPTPPH